MCRPEFLNRLDEIIVFRQLSKSEVKEIADIMLKEVFNRAEEKGIKIDVTERFKVPLFPLRGSYWACPTCHQETCPCSKADPTLEHCQVMPS